MCGIVGYVGKEQVAPILSDGLSRLEYRGYDSAGIAYLGEDQTINITKARGRLQILSDMLDGGAKVGTLIWESGIPAGLPTESPRMKIPIPTKAAAAGLPWCTTALLKTTFPSRTT